MMKASRLSVWGLASFLLLVSLLLFAWQADSGILSAQPVPTTTPPPSGGIGTWTPTPVDQSFVPLVMDTVATATAIPPTPTTDPRTPTPPPAGGTATPTPVDQSFAPVVMDTVSLATAVPPTPTINLTPPTPPAP